MTIDAEIGVYQGIDDQIMNIELLVDGTSIGSQACPDHCTFVGIELGKGVHQLQLLADSNGYTTSVTVYVDEELPATDTGSEGGEGGSESGGTGDESGDESSGGVDGGGVQACGGLQVGRPAAAGGVPQEQAGGLCGVVGREGKG